MKYEIKSIIGENCITLDDGEMIYNLVFPELKKKNEVELDFSGVRIYASPFFNAAIGKLLSDFSNEDLKEKLHFKGLSEHGNQVLSRVIQNARNYYSDPKYKNAVEKIIIKQSKSC